MYIGGRAADSLSTKRNWRIVARGSKRRRRRSQKKFKRKNVLMPWLSLLYLAGFHGFCYIFRGDFGLCGAGPGYTDDVVRSLLVYFLPNAEREKTDVNPSPLTSFDKNAIRSSSSSPMASNGVASMRFFFCQPLDSRRSPKMRIHYT